MLKYIFKKIVNYECAILAFFIILYLLIRLINYTYYLNFSSDQATSSSRALDIYQNRTLTLIGPPTSLTFQGRYIFYGSITYYFQLVFLILGKFDPIKSSLLFTICTSFTIIPLFYGMKWLSKRNNAYLVIIIYSFLPLFINYTRFLWNPNFQLVLSTLLIFLLGLIKIRPKRKIALLFILGITIGILTQFHYQYFLVQLLICLYIYYYYRSNKTLFIFIVGVSVGFIPMILFEFRNNFYNIKTIVFIMSEQLKLTRLTNSNISISVKPHYYLSILLVSISLIIQKIKNIKITHLTYIFIIFLIIDIFLFTNKPRHAFGMNDKWNYLEEEKVNQIIENNNISNFNITNLIYDTKAEVQKYLLKKDKIQINFEDYSNNSYLYIIAKNKDFLKDKSYEIQSILPATIINIWQINNLYNLYLIKHDII